MILRPTAKRTRASSWLLVAAACIAVAPAAPPAHQGPRLGAVISTNPSAAFAAAAARLQLPALGEQGKLEVRTRSFELGQVAEAIARGRRAT